MDATFPCQDLLAGAISSGSVLLISILHFRRAVVFFQQMEECVNLIRIKYTINVQNAARSYWYASATLVYNLIIRTKYFHFNNYPTQLHSIIVKAILTRNLQYGVQNNTKHTC